MTDETYVRVLEASALPHAAKAEVTVGGASILVCNWKEQIFAVSNICSHADEKLHCGRFSNGWIACPVHGARFDLATGNPKNPPATRPIRTYPVRVVDGWIEVSA